MKLSTLKGREQTVRILVPSENGEPDDEVKVVFKPGALTFDTIEQIQLAAGTGQDMTLVAQLLETILVSWDLQEDLEDGSVRQLTTSPQDIRKVPLPFIGLLMDAITNEARGNPQRGATSDDSSPQEGSQEAPQPGTAS